MLFFIDRSKLFTKNIAAYVDIYDCECTNDMAEGKIITNNKLNANYFSNLYFFKRSSVQKMKFAFTYCNRMETGET